MDYADVSNTFVRLADTHFVQRCPLVPETPETPEAPPPPAPTLVINEKDMYVVPRLNLVGEKPPRSNPGCYQVVSGVFGERSAARCSPESVTVVFKSKRRRLCLTGKGKRRRSCDEEENGEHKAKKQKQDGGSSEVLGALKQCRPRLSGAVNRSRVCSVWQGWRQLPVGQDAACLPHVTCAGDAPLSLCCQGLSSFLLL